MKGFEKSPDCGGPSQIRFGLIACIVFLSGCGESEQWQLYIQGNALYPAYVETVFAASTGRFFADRLSCISEAYRLSSANPPETPSGLIDTDHRQIRLDFFCVRTR